MLLLPKETDVSLNYKWHAVTDFRKLNEWAVGYAYPLSKINDSSDHIGKAKYFPTVDQVQLVEKVSVKSEFEISTGHFEFLLFQWT